MLTNIRQDLSCSRSYNFNTDALYDECVKVLECAKVYIVGFFFIKMPYCTLCTFVNGLFYVVNEPPSFLTVPDSKEAKQGDKVKFTCKARGKPLPEISWGKGEEDILEAEGVSIETKQRPGKYEVESSLVLNKVVVGDENDYNIFAENHVGRATHEFELLGKIFYAILHFMYICKWPFPCSYI